MQLLAMCLPRCGQTQEIRLLHCEQLGGKQAQGSAWLINAGEAVRQPLTCKGILGRPEVAKALMDHYQPTAAELAATLTRLTGRVSNAQQQLWGKLMSRLLHLWWKVGHHLV